MALMPPSWVFTEGPLRHQTQSQIIAAQLSHTQDLDMIRVEDGMLGIESIEETVTPSVIRPSGVTIDLEAGGRESNIMTKFCSLIVSYSHSLCHWFNNGCAFKTSLCGCPLRMLCS